MQYSLIIIIWRNSLALALFRSLLRYDPSLFIPVCLVLDFRAPLNLIPSRFCFCILPCLSERHVALHNLSHFKVSGPSCLVFESPVQSGFFAFLGTTGPQPVVLPYQNGTTATGPLPTGCHRLCYQLQPVVNQFQLNLVALGCSRFRPVATARTQ